MKAPVYNQENVKIDEMDLPERIWNIPWNPDLVAQVQVAQIANSRKTIAKTKDRGEVSGGGKKPWRQKGTGRARHGSSRSPLWVHGGVTFGPTTEKIFKKRINKKMKRLAFFSVLSRKLFDNEVKIVDSIETKDAKTKNIRLFTKNIVSGDKSALFVYGGRDGKFKLAARNLQNIMAVSPLSLNIHDILKQKYMILDKESVVAIEKHYK